MTRKPKRRLYYMHPINTYGTDIERMQMQHLKHLFDFDWEIVNPNAPEHQVAYEALKKETGDGMPYFVTLAEGCEAGVYLPFRDGMIPAGIAKEIASFMQRGCRVWEFRHDGRLFRMKHLNEEHVLDVPATRARIRNEDDTPKAY